MLLVIVNHLWGRPWAGFFGVDVFFVISGFLITGVLLRERHADGRVDLVGFYTRRFKRLAPAAVVASAVTVVASVPLFSTARFQQTLTDALTATVAAANWRFAWLGTDYMHRSDAPSPFLHYWSLSVEEQFYLVWPLLLVTVGTIVAARAWRRSWLVTIGVVFVASLTWSFWQTATDPTTAYFSTPGRGWELAAGGLVAALADRLRHLPRHLYPLLSWGGVAGLAAAVLLTGPDSAVPAPGGVTVVLSTAAIIIGGLRGPVRLLTLRPLVLVGTMSYSLYLWHFPVIVLLAQIFPQRATKFTVAALALTALLGAASFHLVEEPLRRARWTRAFSGRSVQRPRSSRTVSFDSPGCRSLRWCSPSPASGFARARTSARFPPLRSPASTR